MERQEGREENGTWAGGGETAYGGAGSALDGTTLYSGTRPFAIARFHGADKTAKNRGEIFSHANFIHRDGR